mgnify:CR=1 FL=1
MIRIVYVSEALIRNSGVTSVIVNLIHNISKDDIKIDLLTYKNSDKEILDDLKKCGVNIFYMPELSFKSFLTFKKSIDDFFECHEYDVVHSHFNQIDGIVFKIAKSHGVKVCISHSHNTKLSDSTFKAIRNRILCYRLPKEATVWAACSEEAGKCLYGKRFTNSSKKLIIRNGIDSRKFKYNDEYRRTIRNEFGIKEDTILLGNIGGFRTQKNHVFLIDVFNELIKHSNKYKLLLVGDGELRHSIEKKVINLGIQNYVIFAGTRTDIEKIMSAIDLFILPSLYEGLPVVGIEAQAAGLNCIFSDSITRNANLTNVIFISLNEKIEKWCETIQRMDISRHYEYQEMIINKGFDISNECKRLTEFYINSIKEKNK